MSAYRISDNLETQRRYLYRDDVLLHSWPAGMCGNGNINGRLFNTLKKRFGEYCASEEKQGDVFA